MTDVNKTNNNKTQQNQKKSIISLGIRNYETIPGDRKDITVALKGNQILEQIKVVHGDWPRRCNGRLFVVDHEDHVRWLDRQADLFAWLSSGKHLVFWSNKDGCLSKEEFLSFLRGAPGVGSYDSVVQYPVFPSQRNIFCPYKIKPSTTPKLDEFCSFFSFATEYDRLLFKAMFCTLFASGLDGLKPLFVITSEEDDLHQGRGVGKSSVAYVLSLIVGSPCKFSVRGVDDSANRLLQSRARFVLFDNVKGYKTSSAALEDLITAPTINGHLMYVGDHEVNNSFTYLMTYNDPSMSKDLAQRSVIIRLKRPKEDFYWGRRVREYAHVNRHDLIAEAGELLTKPKPKISVNLRFIDWALHVLMAVTDDPGVVRHINACVAELDGEKEERQDIISCLAENIARFHYLGIYDKPVDIDLSKQFILVKKSIVAQWLRDAMNWGNMHASTIGKKLMQARISIIAHQTYESNGVKFYIFGEDALSRIKKGVDDTAQRSCWAITDDYGYGNSRKCREIKFLDHGTRWS